MLTTKKLVLGAVGAMALLNPAPAAAVAPTAEDRLMSIDCVPLGSIAPSETYGSISQFGARCDQRLDVVVTGKLYQNGVLVKQGSRTCNNTTHQQLCSGILLQHNPAGTQSYTLVVSLKWRHSGTGDTWLPNGVTVKRQL